MIDSEVFKNCSEDVKKDLIKKNENFSFDLQYTNDQLTLTYEGQSVFCDFLSSKYLLEVRQNYSRSESVYCFLKPLMKQKNKRLKILDLTAGLGRDLFKFILSGHQVTAFEKDPVIYMLLKDGLQRFLNSDKSEALKNQFKIEGDFLCNLHYGNSFTYLEEIKEDYDLIYFDPMFDDKRKKAAPKKHMQMIKSVVEDSKVTKNLVLKASEYLGKKKPLRVISNKGFNYYIFEKFSD